MKTVKLEQDAEGNLILPLGDDVMAELGWEIGDTVRWIDNQDGTWRIEKVLTPGTK